MSALGRPCTVCGIRVTDGTGRCPTHKDGAGRPQPCKICGARTTTSGYCPDHQPDLHAERLRRQPWRAAYDTPEARAEKAAALKRDGFRCVECRRGPADGVTLEVDHVQPLAEGLELGIPLAQLIHRDNLLTRCTKHYHAKTATDRARRARNKRG